MSRRRLHTNRTVDVLLALMVMQDEGVVESHGGARFGLAEAWVERKMQPEATTSTSGQATHPKRAEHGALMF